MDNSVNTIHVVTTGGTIEKSYDETDGTLENRASIIQNGLFRKLRLPYTELKIHPLMAKDSLYMDDNDRAIIVAKVRELASTGSPVVVFHGTDTMAESATRVHNELASTLKRPVVFTGAMMPMGFEQSDALQNATEAILASQLLAGGVFIAFHGRLFPLPNVRKNRDKRTFEQI